MENIVPFPGPASALTPDEADRASERDRRLMLVVRDGLLELSSNLTLLKLMLCEMQCQVERKAAAIKKAMPAGKGEP